MKTLYLECAMGAAGDMLMAALYELLDDREGFLRTMNSLGLPGVEVRAEPSSTAGIAGTHMRVLIRGEEEGEPQGHDHDHEHSHDHPHAHSHGSACCAGHAGGGLPHLHVHPAEEPHAHPHAHAHGHSHSHAHAGPGEIAAQIDALPLPEEVRRRARAVYGRIAQAEAKVHGCPVGDVHFHEVGALDAVADVTGVCYAMYLLGADTICASPVHIGSGTVRCAHGVMPVPAPATAFLLEGVPIYGGAVRGELCTPTGAALLREFASSFGPMPAMVPEKTGVGVGMKQFEQANCVRAFLGEAFASPKPAPAAEASSAGSAAQGTSGGALSAPASEANGEICELVCNLDDMTPEALAFASARLLELGALDVYLTPGTMKKGRPGHVLTVLCEPSREAELARLILLHTATIGLRVRRCAKYFLTPGSSTAQTPWGPVRIKTAEGFGVKKCKAEFEDAAAIARETGIPLSDVEEAALCGKFSPCGEK